MPKGEIFLPDADVRLAATVFYPGWTARTPNGGLFPEADGSRRWWIADKGNAATNFVGRTAATVAADGSLFHGWDGSAVSGGVARRTATRRTICLV